MTVAHEIVGRLRGDAAEFLRAVRSRILRLFVAVVEAYAVWLLRRRLRRRLRCYPTGIDVSFDSLSTELGARR